MPGTTAPIIPIPVRTAVLALVAGAAPLAAQLPSGSWQYVWGDDFSGSVLDTSKWSYNYPWGTTHNHNATMSPANVRFGDGTLTLVAERTGGGANDFRSGAISTGYNNERVNGGYIEARILLPDTPGSWPAFWGLDDGWPPECDIMEYPIDTAAGSGYSQTQYHTAFHYSTGSGNAAGAGMVDPGEAGDLGGSYHTFGLHWIEDDYLGFYFDGSLKKSFGDNAAVAQMSSMYLILNHAVGGWPGTPNTSEWPVGHSDQTKVDWVRVWRSASARTTEWTTTGTESYRQWDTGGHWTNGVPNLGGVTASFGTVPAAEQRIDWSGRRTLSVLNLDGGTRYRFGWPDDRLVLGHGNSGSIAPAINLAVTTASEQEIHGQLEWSGTIGINNNSAQPLLLTGAVMGGDGIHINGPGVVSFDGDDNSYSGTTVIDSGTAGPGVARARGRHPLGTGKVIIGLQGNSTTARLELEDDALVSNPTSLNGRNNASAGIVSNSGTNTLSGTISAQVGGSDYRIESRGGLLRLTGTSGEAGGIALTAEAGGSRTFTLQGAGDGVVGGGIIDGNATVSLVKEGSGSWTLQANNTYTGTTRIAGGTLVVGGSTGTGPTTVESAATLISAGRIHHSLSALSGSVVRIGGGGMQAHWKLDEGSGTSAPDASGNGHDGTLRNDPGRVRGIDGGAVDFDGSDDWIANDSQVPIGGDYTISLWLRTRTTSTGVLLNCSRSGGHGIYLSVESDGKVRALHRYPFGTSGGTSIYSPGAVNDGAWHMVTLVNDGPELLMYLDGQLAATGAVSAQIPATGMDVVMGTLLNQPGTRAYDGTLDEVRVYADALTATEVEAVYGNGSLEAATLDIDGPCSLASGAAIEFDLVSPGAHDRLVVAGTFNASGTLRVAFAPGAPTPQAGDAYDLFDATGGSVAFSVLDLPPLPAGLTWDTSGISGGTLAVVVDPGSYAAWAMLQGFAPGDDSPGLDLEGDGLANAFEWLLGGDPHLPDPALLPVGQLRQVTGTAFPGADPAKRYMGLRATIRKTITGMGLTAQAAASPELLDAPGSSDQIVSSQLEDRGDFEVREWIHTVPVADASPKFMRLKITSP